MFVIPKQPIPAVLVIMAVIQFAAACDERCTVSDPCEASSSLEAIDAAEFSHVAAFEATNYEGVTPLMQLDHWQLRQQIAGPDWQVLAQGGDRDLSELTDAERQQLANAPVVDGFTLDCQPSTCKRHFISLVRDSVKVWARPADAIKFLGGIDTETEAVLVARAHGFAFSPTDKRLGGVLRIGDDFLLLAFKTTRICDPIETTRYLLKVVQGATLSELGSGVTSRRDGCFVI
jgi:hypothetical protein